MHSFGLRLVLVVCVSVWWVGPTVTHAQQATAAIRGRVTDAQQGVLPGVTVVATHQDSGVFRQTITGPDGTYSMQGLPPGPYRVSAELSGFQRTTREGVSLVLGLTQALDLTLQVGSLEQTVTVTGVAPQVDLTASQVGGNIAVGEVQELPSQNRNWVGAITVVPGVQFNPTSDPANDSVSVNGQGSNAVNYYLDGGGNNDDNFGLIQVRVPIEAIQEVQVVTSQFDAQYGEATGAIINAITKSGTNTFRGSTYGFFTNTDLIAKDFFAARDDLEEPDVSRYQYGATIGGPIVRDKAHFFFAYERQDLQSGASFVYPSRPEKSFATNPAQNTWNTLIRFDHQLNANNSYGARWLREWAICTEELSCQAGVGATGFTAGRPTANTFLTEWDTDQTLVLHYNAVVSPTKLNVLRFTWTHEDVEAGLLRGIEPVEQRAPTLRHLSFDDQAPFAGAHRWQPTYVLNNEFSWFIPESNHDVKFGAQYTHASHRVYVPNGLNGIFSFPSDRPYNPSDPSTYPERFSVRVPVADQAREVMHSASFFAQDKWQLSRALTVSGGLRYDVDIAPVQLPLNPLMAGSDDYPVDWNNLQPRLGFAYATNSGRAVLRGGYGHFYQRLRANWIEPFFRQGIFTNSAAVSFPVDQVDPGPANGRLPTDPFLVNGPVVNRDLLDQLFPADTQFRNVAAVVLDNPDRKSPSVRHVTFGYQRELAGRLSVAADYVHISGRDEFISYDLNPGVKATTSRTAPITRVDLLGLASRLGLDPFRTSVLTRENIGKSEYDGLNLQVERRFADNWGGRASYTLGYARGDNDGGVGASNNFQVLAERNLADAWGPSSTDRTHILTLSGRVEVPRTGGLTISSVFRAMSGRPFSITDSTFDTDRNGIAFDLLSEGTYAGTGPDALTVETDGSRNGARGPGYAQFDLRLGYRFRLQGGRTLDVNAEGFNLTSEPNFVNPSGDRRLPTFLVPTALLAGGFPRQVHFSFRLGF
jgi:hypothetical protein